MHVRVYHCMYLSVCNMDACMCACMYVYTYVYICMHGCNFNEYPDCVKQKEHTLQALKLAIVVKPFPT